MKKEIIRELQELNYKFGNKIVINNDIQNNLTLSEYLKKYNTNIIIKDFQKLTNDELLYAIKTVEKFTTNNNEIRKTFYKDLNESLKDRIEILLEQIEHYLSTYGTLFEGEMYHKNEKLNEKNFDEIIEKLIIIDTVSINEGLELVKDLLYKNIAFESSDVKNIAEVVSFYELYVDLDRIQNKELKFQLKKKFGFKGASDWEYLHRYLHELFFGKALFIKSNEYLFHLSYTDTGNYSFDAIIKYFNSLNDQDLIELSKRFNRDKKLFTAIKQLRVKSINKKINKISKLSKKYHQPYKLPKYLNIINSSNYDFIKTIEDLDISYIVKIGNALKYRINAIERGLEDILVRIRNGKFYVTDTKFKSKKFYETKYEILKNILSKKINEKLKFNLELDDTVDFAIPQSMKQFLGNYPIGTQIKIKDNENIFVGISWYGEGVDFDLSVTNDKMKIGWNADYVNEDMFFSGDITSAPNGATELIYFRKVTDNYNINVNYFYGDDDNKFKFFIGKKELNPKMDFNMSIENLVDIDDLIFVNEFEMKKRSGMKMGVITPENFTFINLNTNGSIAGIDKFMDVFLCYKDSFMKFSELELENKEDRETKKITDLTVKELINLVS